MGRCAWYISCIALGAVFCLCAPATTPHCDGIFELVPSPQTTKSFQFLLIRKLEGATLFDVHADFNQPYPSDKEDRNLSYVLFLRALDGNDLHSRIDQLWSEINLAKDLSVRDVLLNDGATTTIASIKWMVTGTKR